MSFLDTQDLLTNSSSSSAPSGDLGDLGGRGNGRVEVPKKKVTCCVFQLKLLIDILQSFQWM